MDKAITKETPETRPSTPTPRVEPKPICTRYALPLGNRIMIEPEPIENKTKSGVVLDAKEEDVRFRTATVKMTGPGLLASDGITYATPFVDVDDRVLYDPLSVIEYTDHGTSYVLIQENNIIMILPPKKEGTK